MNYWDRSHMPRLQRIVFDNTLDQKEAVELVKTSEGRVDLVTELRPLDTLRVAESPFAMDAAAMLRKASRPGSENAAPQSASTSLVAMPGCRMAICSATNPP